MIIPTGFGQVNLEWSGENAPTGAQITFGIQPSGLATPADAGLAVETAIVSSGFVDLLSDDILISNIHVKYGPNETGPFADFATSQTGAESTPGVPPNVAALVRKNTAVGGRAGVGRFFLPGISENNTDGAGNLNVSFRSNLQAAMDDFLADLASNDAPMYLLHNESIVPTAVTGLAVQAVAATQRRRLRR